MTQGITEADIKKYFETEEIRTVEDAMNRMWEPFIDFFSNIDAYEFITEVMK